MVRTFSAALALAAMLPAPAARADLRKIDTLRCLG
jgi:hypothetical protein